MFCKSQLKPSYEVDFQMLLDGKKACNTSSTSKYMDVYVYTFHKNSKMKDLICNHHFMCDKERYLVACLEDDGKIPK